MYFTSFFSVEDLVGQVGQG